MRDGLFRKMCMAFPTRGPLIVVIGLLLVALAAGSALSQTVALTQLTDSRAAGGGPEDDSYYPAISADGSTVAFTSRADLTGGNPDNTQELFVINSDGTGLRQLTSGTRLHGHLLAPSLSADGSVIAFGSPADLVAGGNSDGRDEVFLINSDGTDLRQLTSTGWDSYDPTISADGLVVAFFSYGDIVPGTNPYHRPVIFVMNSDGTGVEQLTTPDPGGRPSAEPSINADGSVVAFASRSDLIPGGNPDRMWEVFAINSDGTGLTQLTSGLSHSQRPSISADGSVVAFDSGDDLLPGGNSDYSLEVFIVNSDGTGLAQLTADPNWSTASGVTSISADGRIVAFHSGAELIPGGNPDGFGEVFVVNADGTGLRQLTSAPRPSGGVSTSGDGSMIAFFSEADLVPGGNPDNSLEVFLAVTADTIPPAITAPADVQAEESDPLGTPVDLGQPTVSDNSDPDPTVENDAPALFPLGVTTVIWTATDAAGNSATAQQTVTVMPGSPDNQLANLRKLILYGVASGEIAPEMEDGLLAKVDAAIAALDRGDPPGVKVVMNDLKALVNQVEAQTDKKIGTVIAGEIIARASNIIATLGG